jgi:hypothetical protein
VPAVAATVPDTGWAALELVLAAVLLGWAWRRARTPSASPGPRRGPRGVGPVGLGLAGLLFGVSAATDPTFLAVVALAAREPLGWVVLAFTLWFLLSQAPLVVLGAAVAARREAAMIGRLRALGARHRLLLRRLVTGAIAATGVLLLADALALVATGSFLLG